MNPDPWAAVAAEHDLNAADTDRARRFAARGDRVLVVQSGWFHRDRFVTSRSGRDPSDVVVGKVVAVYQPDGMMCPPPT